MKKNSFIKGVAFFMLVAFSFEANAASLYMDPAFSSIGRGDAVAVSVRLDTNEEEEECINAVDGVIRYSEDLALIDISTGDSIFSVWVEPPKINKEEHTVTFAGGLPNGYCGRVQGDPRLTNNIVKLIFRSPGFSIGASDSSGTTSAKIEFAPETTAYLNDGFGTKAELALYGANIDLSDTPGATIEDPWREAVVTDTIPPSQFSIQIERDTKAFNGDYFIVFNSVDKQTGIDQYQVMEEPLSKFWDFDWGRADAPWITARSPYVLEDQSLNSTIRVKAIDKAGNEYIATLVPSEDMRGLSPESLILFVGFGLFGLILLTILIVAGRALWKRRKEKRLLEKKEEVNDESHD
ncbi:MAG: hypothetical protein KBC62_04655 [Candidatus Pacebacteria bacterium]|nr:hypothetical protein [Candidatus Paceibacterota bacterium]MBP9843258.1 hypothetical protein [Candidatus Paceibacterota bacterium]